jgi:hypothetical protein
MKLTPIEDKSVGLEVSCVWSIDHEIFPEWFKSLEVLSASTTGFSIQQRSIFQSQHQIICMLPYCLTLLILRGWVTWIVASIQDMIFNVKGTSKTFSKSILNNKDSQKNLPVCMETGLRSRSLSHEKKTIVSYSVSTEFAPSKEFCKNCFDLKLENDCKLSKNETKILKIEKLSFILEFPKLCIILRP